MRGRSPYLGTDPPKRQIRTRDWESATIMVRTPATMVERAVPMGFHAVAYRSGRVGSALLISLLLALGGPAIGQDGDLNPDADAPSVQKFDSEELRSLLAPLALYPDALLAQIFPASTHPLHIVMAQRFLDAGGDSAHPPANAHWDGSVVALLSFPTVLKRMSDDLEWTERLGFAVTYQMEEVTDTLQQIRAEAHAAGILPSNDKQTVIVEHEVIRIVPAEPEVIYVPVYDPAVIFIRHDRWEPFIIFSLGIRCGFWFFNDFDWRHRRIYVHHFWHAGRWVRPSYPYCWRPPVRPINRWQLRDRRWIPSPPVRPAIPAPTRPIAPLRPSVPAAPVNPPRLPHPATPTRPTPPSRPAVTIQPAPPSRPLGTRPPVRPPLRPTEGWGTTRQQTTRESNRGANSRTGEIRPVPAPRTIHPAPSPYQFRPQDRRGTQRESQRGSSSRGGTRRGR